MAYDFLDEYFPVLLIPFCVLLTLSALTLWKAVPSKRAFAWLHFALLSVSTLCFLLGLVFLIAIQHGNSVSETYSMCWTVLTASSEHHSLRTNLAALGWVVSPALLLLSSAAHAKVLRAITRRTRE